MKDRIEALAARRIGITVVLYRRRRVRGEKWCSDCKAWKPSGDYPRDRSRGDGLSSRCKPCARERARKAYTPKKRPSVGRRYVAARAGDKLQARRRVNYLIEIGKLPHPSELPCADCGDETGDSRHEYDHYRGYGPRDHETVEAVCASCHHKRN